MNKKSIIFLLFATLCLSPSCAISQTHERSVSTIRHEDSLKPMEGLGDTVQVVAYLCGYRSEENDGDFHLYLEDDSCGLVAEAMPDTRGMEEFKAFKPRAKNTPANWKPIRVKVTGLRYYDHEHGMVKEGCFLEKSDLDHFRIEIHPVLKIELLNSE